MSSNWQLETELSSTYAFLALPMIPGWGLQVLQASRKSIANSAEKVLALYWWG